MLVGLLMIAFVLFSSSLFLNTEFILSLKCLALDSCKRAIPSSQFRWQTKLSARWAMQALKGKPCSTWILNPRTRLGSSYICQKWGNICLDNVVDEVCMGNPSLWINYRFLCSNLVYLVDAWFLVLSFKHSFCSYLSL